MKATGIVRKIDELGRVVIPMEIRKTLSLGTSQPMEIFTDGDAIVLRPYGKDREKEEVINKLFKLQTATKLSKEQSELVTEVIQFIEG